MLTTNEYCKIVYNEKLYKLSLDIGCTCPNRDGSKGTGGCIFCSAKGSGDFASKIVSVFDINTQIEMAKKRVSSKFKGDNYIAYFQSFTNTYAPVEKLEKIYMSVASRDYIAILSIATRPDCLEAEVLDLLFRLNQIKPVWVELGLQTTNECTARFINRCYENDVYYKAVKSLKRIGVHVITHMIIGLPGETQEDMLRTVSDIIKAKSDGIKLQLLHVLKDTKLEEYYNKKMFQVLSLDEYIEILKKIVSILPNNMVVHRFTGDGPKDILVAPKWSANKKMVLNRINKEVL